MNIYKILWDKIDENTAVWCKTEDEALIFLSDAYIEGYEWCNGHNLIDETHWDKYKNDTAYLDFSFVTGISYGNRKTLNQDIYKIVPFTDIAILTDCYLCEALKVKPDEAFTFENSDGIFRIHDGQRQRLNKDKEWISCAYETELTDMINNPEGIAVYTPDMKWTEEDYWFAELLLMYYPEGEVKRKHGTLMFREKPGYGWNKIPNKLFPSLYSDECFSLKSIVESCDEE